MSAASLRDFRVPWRLLYRPDPALAEMLVPDPFSLGVRLIIDTIRGRSRVEAAAIAPGSAAAREQHHIIYGIIDI